MSGPKDGEHATVPADFPDRVVMGLDSCNRRVVYERDEHNPCRYRFRGWAVGENEKG